MHVALDARNLQDRPRGGIGRALANIVPLLREDFDITLLYDPRRGSTPADGVVLRSAMPTATAWLQSAAARWLRSFDGVFHCPFYELPFLPSVPMVVSLWDLTFESHPEWFPPAKRLAFRTQARHAARTARRIIVASQTVAEDVRERYGVDPASIVVAPLAADPLFHSRPIDEVQPLLTTLGIDRPYVVSFGGAHRRRLDLAIRAWSQAGGSALCQLVAIGGAPPDSPAGVVTATSLDDPALACLVAGASALLYPTEYEGFGLPAVEAQASGTPVICGRVGALPEVLGEHAVWTDDQSVGAFSAALTKVITDDAYHQAVADAGRRWAQDRPGWAHTAAAFARAYREAV